MGMDYYIIPDQETDCEDQFPEGLSFFFEQVGGYDEYAEVSQVSRILQIDLSVFQQISYEEDGAEDNESQESYTIWHDLDTFAGVINNLIAKISRQPDYYTQVLHNPNHKSDRKRLEHIFSNAADEASMAREIEEVMAQALSHYPPDYGYLREGRLVKDLQTLRQTLQSYRSHGVTQIKLLYI